MKNPQLSSQHIADLEKIPIHDITSRLVSLQNLPLVLSGVIFLLILQLISTAVYNVYFHPLSKYPGPKYAAVWGLTYFFFNFRGDLLTWTRSQHEKYGEVVRLAPDKLSYTNPQAWKDIYGHRTGGRKENPKDDRFFHKEYNGEDSILTLPDVREHGRLRKVFTNAFSDKALKLQEPLIRTYVNHLIDNMCRSITKDPEAELDMVLLYNCTTFDIMGDLTFGEPLGLLQQSGYTPWVKAVFGNVKTVDMLRIQLEYPWLKLAMRRLVPKSLREQEKMHFQHSADRVDRRLKKGIIKDKPDIWNLVLEKGSDQLTVAQMHANSSLFMLAGTETTATLLSGLTYHLLKNPDKLRKAVDEIRAIPEDELSLEQLPRLPYLNACFEEGLRVYPPIPNGIPREVALGGSVICGEKIPEKTRVVVHQWSAYRSPLNFRDPDSFIPERWLPGSGYDSDRKDALEPFSTGPRNCLGKNLAYHEMRLIMAKVLWHFDLELCPQSDSWADQKTWALWQKPELWCKARPAR